ncbi:MAG TPA: hypothetical protein DE312_00495 [Gallionella sp.]|jgi:hypothetical protein|nr:hypothetical protein [Gallionella sp.]OGS67031.1 MAG: hypothetical protein A2Z87_02190 [Gallionellales bacterium GWA2_54_124]OGT20824.1 MAG: hypothetical protein A2522_07550 [Gallionellales bacterium RIFOXYD12_FULL_53_10]HCI51804.1 hypothetical protein [Gallionella sp.]
MSAYGIVLKPARVALILFALSVILTFIVIAGLDRYRIEKAQRILTTEKRLSDTREEIRKLTFDLDSIKKLAAKYKKLSELGFIGEPDRDGWVQRLDSIYRDTRLPPTLRYTLAPPQPINPQLPDSPLSYQNNVSHHDLALEIAGIHEIELIDFMNKLKADWKTPYRVETCQIAREAEVLAGLQIKCTVQVYSLPLKP